MSIILFILIATLSITEALERNGRYQHQHRPRGQMGFKWTRRQYTRGRGMRYNRYPSTTEEVETESTGFKSASPVSFNEPDIPGPTLYPEDAEQTIPPQVVIDNTVQPEIAIEPDTTDKFESTQYDEQSLEGTEIHQPPIMDCLYKKCSDSFNVCFNDEQCKEFMREWQESQSLKTECLSSTSEDAKGNEVELVIETTEISIENTENSNSKQECEYHELFWNVYHCGVENHCYNDQLILAASHSYVLSPCNFRVSPTNVTGSKSSSFDATLIMVAITSAISAVILFELFRRLYNGLKDKFQFECECECAKLRNSCRYLKNKWEQIRGYKYEKTHADIDAMEEAEDSEMYGHGTTNIGVTYNGVINNSDISDDDDEELQKYSSKPISLDQQTEDDEEGDIQTDNDDLIIAEEIWRKDNEIINNDDQKEEEEPQQQQQVVTEPTQQL